MRYTLGLDVGIGYIGWAVVRNDEPSRIIDFGVRAFESGELESGKDRTSQQRRRYRAARRLVRRRAHRKHRIKAHLENIGLAKIEQIEEYFREGHTDIISLRVKGLDERLTPEEIGACLINFCNKRGYQDFYEMDESSMTLKEKEEYRKERAGAKFIDSKMASGQYRTIAEMIKLDPYFCGTGNFRSYRNNAWREENLQINRQYLREECALLLGRQSEYYPQLTEQNIKSAMKIIFEQRFFEEGPGKKTDPYHRYTGFLDTYGKCRFYPEENRGCRFTVLADIFALVNVLSQYRYLDNEGAECFTGALGSDLIAFALANGNLAAKDLKAIVKKHGLTLNASLVEKSDGLSKCLKYIKVIKRIYDDAGLDWSAAISQDYRDMNSDLNRLGILLSENQTPRRRIDRLRKLGMFDEKTITHLARQKFSGTSNVSNKYMIGIIDGFIQGDLYGKQQADIVKRLESERSASGAASYKLPSFEAHKDEFEFYKNPVVCRSINETRKIINAVIGRYGSPYAINVEVASDLNRCFDDRQEIERSQKANAKNRENARKEIAKVLGTDDPESISPVQIDRWLLGEQQNWQCLYSGAPIDPKTCLTPNDRTYEIDHIIPYSLILDNTLHNKALVLASENQAKRQRTPLMYLSGDAAEKFIGRVRSLHYSKPSKISKKKFDYLMQETLFSEMMDEWKSRNINDTRYISKFLVRYLRENLLFNHEADEKYRQPEVYAIKGAVTSQMRRLWLNRDTWGTLDKGDLKEITLLDHAADAVVIACCIPAYVEIASVQNKLRNIWKRAGKKETEEYRAVMEDCIRTMQTYHGMSRSVVEPLLRRSDRTPCLIPNLREEVDIRFIEPYSYRAFGGLKPEDITEEEIMAIYRTKCRELYPDDISFADSLQPVIVSHKPNRKASGTITKDNALSVRVIDGEECELSHVSILSLKKKQLGSVYSGDSEMLKLLEELLAPMKDDSTVRDALAAKGEKFFVTPGGRRINKVTLKGKPSGRKLVKQLSDGGRTVLDSTKYYCIEFYYNTKGELNMRGITYGELVRARGKLWLSEQSVLPEDYDRHYMYLHKWDYIHVFDRKGELKFKGYYVSVFNINQGKLCYALDTTSTLPKKALSISRKDTIAKYDIDILGNKGGELERGAPLSSITEKN